MDQPIQIEMYLFCPTSGGNGPKIIIFSWFFDRRAVLMYLQRNKILGFDQYDPGKFIEADMSDHISTTDLGNDIDLPLQPALPGVVCCTQESC